MKRNISKETLAIAYEKAGESVCGVTFGEIVEETIRMIGTPGFLPKIYNREEILASDEPVVLIELAAFAAMNVIRRHNGMPELIDRDTE